MTYLDRLRRDAIHEAAHAVIAVDLGIYLEFVTLNLGADVPGRDGWPVHAFTRTHRRRLAGDDELRRYVIQSLAGPVADGVERGIIGDWRRVRVHAQDDVDCARDLAGGRPLDRSWRLTHRLVRRRWATIAYVAMELLEHETLDGRDVAAIAGVR